MLKGCITEIHRQAADAHKAYSHAYKRALAAGDSKEVAQAAGRKASKEFREKEAKKGKGEGKKGKKGEGKGEGKKGEGKKAKKKAKGVRVVKEEPEEAMFLRPSV